MLQRKEFVGSVYTYLAGLCYKTILTSLIFFNLVLACVDLSTSIVLMLGGISRGVMWNYGWITYDSLIGLPISGMLATIGVLAIVGLTLGKRKVQENIVFKKYFQIELYTYGILFSVPNRNFVVLWLLEG